MMNYTPRKYSGSGTASFRHNPYSSGGRSYLKSFSNKTFENGLVKSASAKLCIPKSVPLRSDKILQNSNCKRLLKSIRRLPFSDSDSKSVTGSTCNGCKLIRIDDKDNDKENRITCDDELMKIYSSKKKMIDISKSRLINDVSPVKIEKAYGSIFSRSSSSSITSDKENVSSEDVQVSLPKILGFPNYGNTCYINAVLQVLLCISTFTSDMLTVHDRVQEKTLVKGLVSLFNYKRKCNIFGIKHSLRCIKEILEKIDESFSGYKMQDANEFLMKVFDNMENEIKNIKQVNGKVDVCISKQESELTANLLKISCSDLSNSGENYNCNKLSGGASNYKSSDDAARIVINDDLSSVNSDSFLDKYKTSPKIDELVNYNPVKDNFLFQLTEFQKCLGCGEVQNKRQEYFNLFVNLSGDEKESIKSAISTCMSPDEREVTCGKCFCNRASVETLFTKLPRVLIIQLKRYAYHADLKESTKVSSRICINKWLFLESLLAENVVPPLEDNDIFSRQTFKKEVLREQNLNTDHNSSEEIIECSNGSETLKSPEKISIEDNEDTELQEVMRKSLEEFETKKQDNDDDDFNEVQKAIQLSLQEAELCYSQNEQSCDSIDVKLDCTVDKESINAALHAYKLIGIVSHFGMATSTGHYVADVYDSKEDCWMHYDDETVTKVNEETVLSSGRQKNGYIFFYLHKDFLKLLES